MKTMPGAGLTVCVIVALVVPLGLNAQNATFGPHMPPPPPIPPEIQTTGATAKTQVDPSYATLYGGTGYDELRDHAVSGNVACMVGATNSTDLTLFQPFQADNAGGTEGWIGCGDVETGIPYFASYFGSDMDETITAADIVNDTLYVVGFTNSETLPGTDDASYQRIFGGGTHDCFVSRMSVFDGSGLKTTFFGLEGADFCADIAASGEGVWITGYTDALIDLVDPLQDELKGSSDALLARLSLDLSTLEFSTLIGGDASDGATAFAVAPVFGGPTTGKDDDLETAPLKRVIVTGWTEGSGLPVTENAYQPTHAGLNDAFIASFLWDVVAATVLIEYATYVGSLGDEVAQAIAYSRGRAIIAGWTTSSGWNTIGRNRISGSSDGFVYEDKLSSETHVPVIAYVGPSSVYNLPLAIVRAALGMTIVAGYAIVPDFGSAFMQALDRQYRVVGNEFTGTTTAAADCNAVMAVLFWWVCGGKTGAAIPTTQLAIQASYGGGQFDMFGAKYPMPFGYSFLFNMTAAVIAGQLHDRDIDPIQPRTLSAAHFIPWDISFTYLLAAAAATYQINRLITALTAQIVFSYIFQNQVLTVDVPVLNRGEIGILAYNDLGRTIEVIRQDKTTGHNEIKRTTVEAGQFFFIPLPNDQNVAITDGVNLIVYTPSKRWYRLAFPYFAGVLQDRVAKGAGSQEFELLLFDGDGDLVELPVTTASENADDLPGRIAFHVGHPNPFSVSTTLQYEIPDGQPVRLEIYDIMGRLVRTLVSGLRTAGTASVEWDGRNDTGHPMASGTYLARFEAGGHVITRAMVLAR